MKKSLVVLEFFDQKYLLRLFDPIETACSNTRL
jgi:hypothetical protein